MFAGEAGMPDKSKAVLWNMEGESWRQEGDSFVLESLDGAAPPDNLTDLDWLAGAHRISGSSGYLPRQFAYSPFDGKRLQAPHSSGWLPPAGAGMGGRVVGGHAGTELLALLERLDAHWRTNRRSMQESAESIRPPTINGVLYFCADAGGHRDALFALSRSGVLWLWQRGVRQWLPVQAEGTRLSTNAFEHWAASVVALPGKRGSDIVIAGDDGADCVSIDAMRTRYRLDRLAGKAIGGPGMLGDAALVPMRRDGMLQLAMRRPDVAWQASPVEGGQGAGERLELLAAPIGTVNGQGLLWIGERGWLVAQGHGDRIEARWNDWPAERVARPILGPPFRDGSGYWQLLYGTDDAKWRYQLLDAATPYEHVAPRASIGTGRSSFQFNVRVDRPWQDFDHDLHRMEYVLHPFLELESTPGAILEMRAPRPPAGPLTSFYDQRGVTNVQYGISLPGISQPHQYGLDAAKPWNAQWFVHDDALWLWIDERGKLLRWSTTT